MSGLSAGEITITVMTPTSGINGQFSGIFWFVITPVHERTKGDSVPHLFLSYQSGTFETIVIDGLEEGASYTFNATATNIYGSSQAATSVSILAGAPHPQSQFSSYNNLIIVMALSFLTVASVIYMQVVQKQTVVQ